MIEATKAKPLDSKLQLERISFEMLFVEIKTEIYQIACFVILMFHKFNCLFTDNNFICFEKYASLIGYSSGVKFTYIESNKNFTFSSVSECSF